MAIPSDEIDETTSNPSKIQSSAHSAMDPPPPQPPPPPPIDFLTVLLEAWRIIKAHSRHFLALSVLFLLPVSFSITVYPTLISPSSSSGRRNSAATQSLFFLRLPTGSDHPTNLVLLLAFAAFASLFALFATASITHSTVQGFYGRPVKLLPAIKSIFINFFPLVATVLCTNLIVVLILAILWLFVFLVAKGIELIWHRVVYSSPYFIGFVVMIAVVFLLIVFYLQVQWTLASVLVVSESVWGFYPLKRSVYLVKGMRKVALYMILFFGVIPGILLTTSSWHPTSGWNNWAFVLEIVGLSSFITMFMQLHLAANVVLYMYCKAIHGELALEIAEEFARDYVSLPFDDGKVPHVVSVAYA